MEGKPRVFIASSAEAIPVAEAVNIRLEHDAQVTPWDNAFELSSVTITTLIERANSTDYAVFVFHRDDELIMRGETYSAVRDNVLFELGLFVGVLGFEKCFVLVPRSKSGQFRLPSDLAGVTFTVYDDSVDDYVNGVTTSCAKVKNSIRVQEANRTNTEQNRALLNIQQQLMDAQAKVWRAQHDIERAQEQAAKQLDDIRQCFYSVAKPATALEVAAWEAGSKQAQGKEVKITGVEVFYVDRDVVIPSMFGANSISVIVAQGVRLYGVDKWSHNHIYYMDGFRCIGPGGHAGF
ncbi:nucleotide-binding protein [Pseudomonas juntendi]|uniref:nucleotide-binding protein n=1 Tax=Pseudomonas juntendi TaxID=2666183 RepID=UPI00244BDEA7|nr:nucleotide-binding protein [Pseudomonas juntendi]MDG9875002.1 nucleotide-binding protein [Pseudomonas juntendi]